MVGGESEAYGYIGLGVMGHHMVENLAAKLPSNAPLYVYDVSQDAIDRVCKHDSQRVYACNSAADVAAKSVCNSCPLAICHSTNAHRLLLN